MFSHDEFTKRSLNDFLHLECLLNINSEDIKEKFSSFIVKDTEENRKKIFSHVPENLFTDNKKENYLKITKANLLRHQKKQMANPIRTWGNDDEYSTRLIISLLFQATPGWHKYCANLYEHGQDRYIHDQRAGGGRAKQFLNWMYDDEGYPGRLEEQNEYESLIPLCFPNPELLRSCFTYAGDGQYALVVSENWKDGVLYKKLNELKLLHQFTIQEPDDKKKIKRGIVAPFCTWQKAIAEILEEQNLEKQLSEEQQKTHVISLIIEFVKNQTQDVKQLKQKVINFIQHINKDNSKDSDLALVQETIEALYQVRKNITANKEFFDKFTDDKGVLQAEQYFRALTAHIDSEITFLDTFKNRLTEKDLKIFLNQTCSKVHSDINELLLAHDFLLTDDLEHRDIVINFTPKEIKELHQYALGVINTYKFLLESRETLKIEDKNNNEYKIIQEYIDNTKKLIPTLDVDSLVLTIKEEKDSEDFKNELLLNQLKSHPLFEFFNIKNTNETQAKIGELWKIVESDNLNKKLDRSNFIRGLNEVASSCVDNKNAEVVNSSADNKNTEVVNSSADNKSTKVVNSSADNKNAEVVNSSADNKNTKVASSSADNGGKKYVKESKWLAFKQWLYNVSYYVPLSSIWLSHINPGKSRTKTKYKGKTLKEKLYTKNRVIQCSEFSQNIRKALSLSTDDKEFVESKHEASWLIKTFRRKHRISGAKEKVLTYLGKNKILWYTLLTIFILLTSAAAIAGRVLSCLGIIPPVAVDKMINGLRGIFDGFVVMFGLDTIIDSIFILAVDLAGLVVRTVDYILLFGLISKTIRFLTKGVSKVIKGISSGFKALYETVRVYGLKGSLILLHDKITNNKQSTKEEKCEIEEKAQKKKDIMIGQEGNIDNISSSIQQLWRESLIEGSQSNSERIGYVFSNLKSQIETDLLGGDIKFSTLSSNFSSIHDLFKSATDWNFIKFQYEFHYLLNKYPEKFLDPEKSLKKEKVSTGKDQKEDVTVESYRMKIYDVMVAVSLQTKLSPEKQEEITFNNDNAKNIIKKCVDEQAKEFVSQKILGKKIVAVEWAINALKSSGIDFAIKKAEPIFRTTKAHLSAEIALCDYSKKLEELHKRASDERVSADELSAYEMIFARYISNAHYILSSIDKFTAKNHEGSSLHQFREAFSDNCVLLMPPSREAENAALILGIDRGGVSLVSRIKEYTVDFVEEFQDPKVFAVAFAAYYIAVQIPGLLEVAHTITDVPEIMLDHAGLGMVYEHFLKTDVGRTLIEMVYQRGELLKDVWVLFNEFKDGVIGESELKKRWSEVKQAVKRAKPHNNHDHHGGGSAKERLASFINGFIHFILTILCINLIRSLLHKTKTEYHTFSYYYREKQVVDISKDAMLDKEGSTKSIVDNSMYNSSQILECLSNKTFVENVFYKMQDCPV